MTDQEDRGNQMFLGLVQQYQFMSLIHLGKMVHPESQKMERNLDVAKAAIDLLGMLEEKTKGNLTTEESRFLQQVLTNLRLNFVDESKKEETTDEKKEEGEGKEPSSEQAGDTPS